MVRYEPPPPPPPLQPPHRLHVVSHVGAPAAAAAATAVAAPSERRRDTSLGRPESPGYTISPSLPLANLSYPASFSLSLSPSIFPSSDVTGMESGIDPERPPLQLASSLSRTVLTGWKTFDCSLSDLQRPPGCTQPVPRITQRKGAEGRNSSPDGVHRQTRGCSAIPRRD